MIVSVNYDDYSDVLYVCYEKDVESYASDADDSGLIWYRYSDADDSPYGVTVFKARENWEGKEEDLVSFISEFMWGAQCDELLDEIMFAFSSM